jgi:hypothetical protein
MAITVTDPNIERKAQVSTQDWVRKRPAEGPPAQGGGWTPDTVAYDIHDDGVRRRFWRRGTAQGPAPRQGRAKPARSPLIPTAAWENREGAAIDIAALTVRLWRIVAYCLAVVIIVPTVMSGIHLVSWAHDKKNGLDLPYALSGLPIVTLDGTTIVCIVMVTMAALRREHGGAFHVMSWVMAFVGFAINLRYGLETPQKGDEYYYPAMNLTGPVILEFTLAFLRRWLSIDAGLRFQGVAMHDFGKRLRPGVARRETKAAWKVSQREGITDPWKAIRAAREERLLRGMTGVDALRIAFERIDSRNAFEARLWLLGRGIEVTEQDVKLALEPRDLAEFVAATEDGATATEAATFLFGQAERDDVERARRELDELVAAKTLARDGDGRRGAGKSTRYRVATPTTSDDENEAAA